MSNEIARELMVKLADEFGVIICIKLLHGKAWIRLSANLHNTKQDYIKMRDGLAQVLEIEVQNKRINCAGEEKIQTHFIDKWHRSNSRELA